MHSSYSQGCSPVTELRDLLNDSTSFFLCFCDRNYTNTPDCILASAMHMFTVSALLPETGGAANGTPSFLIVFLVKRKKEKKTRLINAAKFPVVEQSSPDFRRTDDSQRSTAPTVQGARWTPGEADLHLKKKVLWLLRAPPTPAQVEGAAFSCLQRVTRETGRKREG